MSLLSSPIVSPSRQPLVRPSVCRVIPKCSTDTPKVAKIPETFTNLRKKPTGGVTTGALAGTHRSPPPSKMTERNQYSCCVPLLCAVTFAVFMFQFHVMGFAVCPHERVGDLSRLCLLRAKIQMLFLLLKKHYFWCPLPLRPPVRPSTDSAAGGGGFANFNRR